MPASNLSGDFQIREAWVEFGIRGADGGDTGGKFSRPIIGKILRAEEMPFGSIEAHRPGNLRAMAFEAKINRTFRRQAVIVDETDAFELSPGADFKIGVTDGRLTWFLQRRTGERENDIGNGVKRGDVNGLRLLLMA